MGAKDGGTRFMVDLGDLRLPEDTAKSVEVQIRRSVLTSLAGADFQGDLRFRLPPDIYGIVIDTSDVIGGVDFFEFPPGR